MIPIEQPSFEIINRDIKAVLAEMGDIVSTQNECLDPEEIAKNNAAFVQLLDCLLEQARPYRVPFEIK
ncbi:MAG: hypothetical protein JU82_00180 [Sulfuricurvum sp. MLSB]|uniref:hypothetical protein n=1 Tax=unclassified Sulfuricurvum TaxID=2632390 RepID=UPI000500CEFA|nr:MULTISPECIES: hypothetical protein [unclassified Sulfuricurvum]KFN40944.1 MAG: hypothetical protein JU82_00180 [Sulfuricurvum sp. MLSB]